MQIRSFLILLCIIPLLAAHKTLPPTPTKQDITAEDFTQIYIKGNINVDLHSGYKNPKVNLKGDPRDLKYVHMSTSGYALHIIMKKKPIYGPVTAEILGHHITSFHYQGHGQIVGEKFNTRHLDLDLNNHGNTSLAGSIGLNVLNVSGSGLTKIHGVVGHDLLIHLKDKPKLQLTGMINMHRVSTDGYGSLGLTWVDSPEVIIRSHGSVQTFLAGVTNKLDVELWDHSQFNGRYLRAKTSFVKTHDHSRAEISTISRQHTLALDASDIYYFNNSKFEANFMGNNGAVLDFQCPGPNCPIDTCPSCKVAEAFTAEVYK